MKKLLFALLSVLLVCNFLPTSTSANSLTKGLSKEELKIVDALSTFDTKLMLKEERVKAKKAKVDKTKKKLKKDEFEAYIDENTSNLQVQVFNSETNQQVLVANAASLNELEALLQFKLTEEELKANAHLPYFKVPYTMIVSSLDYTGFYNFDRFYINDRSNIDEEVLKGIVEYTQSTGVLENIELEFFKNQEQTKELKKSEVSIACIACVGDIYQTESSSTYNAWTNVAQVHSIKGVKTTFTLSKSKSSTLTISTKTVTSLGEVSTTGSTSNTISVVEQFPVLANTSLSSPGRYAQQEVKYTKTTYKKIKGDGPDRYTQIRGSGVIGGTKWGNYIYANGVNFDSVSGVTYAKGSVVTHTQTSSNTFTGQAGTTAHGYSVSLSVTANATSQNTWKFEFGNDYNQYKIFNVGKYFNLTAK